MAHILQAPMLYAWESVAVPVGTAVGNVVSMVHEEYQQNVANSGAPIGRLAKWLTQSEKGGIITELFLSAVPVFLLYFAAPTAVAIGFWLAYEFSRIGGDNQRLIDRSITIAALFEMVYELAKFATLNLAKQKGAYIHLATAIVAGMASAVFGWRAYNVQNSQQAGEIDNEAPPAALPASVEAIAPAAENSAPAVVAEPATN